jgi:hypothetical protein
VSTAEYEERTVRALESIARSMNAFLVLGYGAYIVFCIRSCTP